MAPAVSIQDATVVRGGRVVLDRISLTVEPGLLLGVTGPNGSGKTTLLNLINGLLLPVAGQVEVLGEVVSPASSRGLRRRVAYLPQMAPPDPRMPVLVRDVVLMGRYGRIGLGRRPGPDDHAAASRAMERVGLTPLADRPIGQLSGGEQQRVALARALAQEAAVLMLVEPTTFLDQSARAYLLELIAAIHAEGRLTTLLVSHELDFVRRICERVVSLESGRLVTPTEVAA